MVSEEFVRHHGLPMHEFSTEFQQADNLPSGRIVGKTNFKLQVHDELELDLKGVPVQPGSYSLLIGSDIINGNGEHIKYLKSTGGKKIEWRLLTRGGLSVHTPVVNPSYHIHRQQQTSAAPTPVSQPTAQQPSPSLPPPPAPSPSTPAAPERPSLITLTTSVVTQDVKKCLQSVADRRQKTLEGGKLPDGDEHYREVNKTKEYLTLNSVPRALVGALGRCLWQC